LRDQVDWNAEIRVRFELALIGNLINLPVTILDRQPVAHNDDDE